MKCPVCMQEVDGRFEICSNCGALLHKSPVNTDYYQQDKMKRNEQQAAPSVFSAPPQEQIIDNQVHAPEAIPPQMPPQPQTPISPVPQQSAQAAESNNKSTKLIILLAVIGIIVVGVVAAVLISSNSNNQPADGNTFITNNYEINVDLRGELIDIQRKYMKNGIVPKEKYPELISETYVYLDEHKEEYNITEITENDESIDVVFDNGKGWTYDPTDFYSFFDEEEESDIDDTDSADDDTQQDDQDIVDDSSEDEGTALEEKLVSKNWYQRYYYSNCVVTYTFKNGTLTIITEYPKSGMEEKEVYDYSVGTDCVSFSRNGYDYTIYDSDNDNSVIMYSSEGGNNEKIILADNVDDASKYEGERYREEQGE